MKTFAVELGLLPADLALSDPSRLGPTTQDELVEAAMGFSAASRPPNTQGRQWRAFEAWGAGQQGASALPAAPATLALYLTARAREGRKVSTLFQAIAAIARKHRDAGLDAPQALIVERTWDGIRRTLGSAPRRVAPATVDLLRKMSAALPSSPLGVRDRALLVLGLAARFGAANSSRSTPSTSASKARASSSRCENPRPIKLQQARVLGCAPGPTR